MEKTRWTTNSIHDVGMSAGLSAKQCDIRSFFVSSERSLLDLNDTLWCAIFVTEAFEFYFISKNIEISFLKFSFEYCNF